MKCQVLVMNGLEDLNGTFKNAFGRHYPVLHFRKERFDFFCSVFNGGIKP